MACALLENSKSQYNIRTRPNVGILRAPDSSTMRTQLTHQLISALKRPAAQVVTQTQDIVIPPKKPISQLQQRLNSVNVVTEPVQPQQQEEQQQQQQQSYQQQSRRRIFWNTSNISTETKFILDVEANQAFGLGTDGRERLASKHPELIRYLPDEEDRNWLVQEKVIPAQNKNSRFLFLVFDEVIKLSQSETYRNRDNLNLQMLHAFKVPNFIIMKMRTFFVDLNIKSRGLITNSFTVTNGVSHLRNALLQGSPLVTSVTSTNGADNGNGGGCLPTSTTTKPKSSLSSQHATLTALLNGNNEAQVVSIDGSSQLSSS